MKAISTTFLDSEGHFRLTDFGQTLIPVDSMSPVNVLLVEDFEPMREVVASIVERRGFQVIGQASDGAEAVQKAEQLKPDLVLLDIGLPKMNGIEAAGHIRNLAPHSKIVFLSQETSPEIVEEALRLGAMGYVHKARLHRDLTAAIEAVNHGRRFVSCHLEVSHPVEAATTETFPCHAVSISFAPAS
jgi:DNA-binding NarL/FixJ family response regulator